MNAVDLWLVVSAVLLGIATLLAVMADNPKMTARHLTAMPFLCGGLLAFMISMLVARN